MIKKELFIFIVVFTVGAVIVHPDLLTAPIDRLEWMYERGNYYHSFVIALAVYLLIGIGRLLVIGIKKLIVK